MKKLIRSYKHSYDLITQRIEELRQQFKDLKSQDNTLEIDRLDLKRRIGLLYVERREVKDIIIHLSSYLQHIEKRKAENKEELK